MAALCAAAIPAFGFGMPEPKALNAAKAKTVAPTDRAGWSDAILRVRQRWPEYRENAVSDARRAHDRHAPERYRAAVAEELAALINRTDRPQVPAHG